MRAVAANAEVGFPDSRTTRAQTRHAPEFAAQLFIDVLPHDPTRKPCAMSERYK